MNAEISLNRYAPNIFGLKALKLSPLAREAFGIIVNLVKKSGRCWISRANFAKLLHCAIGSVSRAITELVKAGLIRRTGVFHAWLFPFVEITARGKEYAPTAPLQARHENVTPPSQDSDREEKEETNDLKEQTTQPVCLPEKIKKTPEESETRLKLQSFGIGKNQSKELCRKYPKERIERQIENLGQALEQGKEIKNQAGWLIKAIRDNFYPSKAQDLKQQVAKESAEAKKRQDAQQHFQRAQDLEMRGQYEWH